MRSFALAALLALAAYSATGVYFVGPDEIVVVRRCGRLLPRPSGPGAHWGLPWGWEQRDRLRPNEVKRITLGPPALVAAPTGNPLPQFLTGDRNLVNIQAHVQYTISDPSLYLLQAGERDRILEQRGLSLMAQQLCGSPVDHLLTSGKHEFALQLRAALQSAVEQYQLGVSIRSLDLGIVEPPLEVAEAFHDVVAALRERQQLIYDANSSLRSTVARAGAEAQRLRDQANGYHDRTLREAEAEAAVFASLLQQYQLAPELTAQRLYLETVAATLPGFRSKLVVATDQEIDLSIIRPPE